ncbi:MAG TPA: DUF2298 domain-containing protein, partial [Chloroflexota bacterium]|nr:DUF2298 domain-containing protein [Chloroflexota bacterium]
EFPFFSFLLGDLHPHVLALPFAFVCLGFALNFLRSTDEFYFSRWREHAFEIGFVALVFGSMFLLNAWDMLTYLFVLVCAFAARRFISRPVFDFRWLRDAAAFGFGSLILAVGVYWPFYLTFRSQATGLLGLVKLHSHLSYFLLFWGPFFFLAASLVIAELAFGWSPLPGGLVRRSGPRWTNGPFVWVALVVVSIGCLFADAPALSLIIPIGVGSIILILRYLSGETMPIPSVVRQSVKDGPAVAARREDRGAAVAGGAIPASVATEHVFALILVFVAMLLLLGTELVYIKDSFDSRMNTVFKLYFQAWVMLALVGGYAIVALGSGPFRGRVARERVARARRPDDESRPATATRLGVLGWLVATAAILGAAFIYVPASVEARSNGFTNEATLNGLAYYQRSQPDDAAAIGWLNQHVSGTPTLVEATGGSYSAFGEVAWMTGIPTLLGWDFHEIQWHGASVVPIEDERKRDIDAIYRSTDARATLDLLAKYGVTYVYVGPMERQVYGQNPAGLSKFSQFMDVIYPGPGTPNQSVTIFKIRGTE